MIEENIPKNPNLGLLVLRVTLALLFIYGGVGKLFGVLGGPGIEGFSGMVWGQVWLAYIVALTELIAGFMLLVGFMARSASFALSVIVIFAIAMVHNPFVTMSELMNALIRLTIIGGFVQIMLSGPGDIFSLEKSQK